MSDKILLVTFSKHGNIHYIYYNQSEPKIFYVDYTNCKEKRNPINNTIEITKIAEALDEFYKKNTK